MNKEKALAVSEGYKIRVKIEDEFQLSTICRQLKLPSSNSKKIIQ